jgi:hypothetical protein
MNSAISSHPDATKAIYGRRRDWQEKELIQPPISYFDYHDLCLKSTTAVKLLDLTLTGSRHYIITIKAHLHHFGYYGNKG